MATVTMTLEEYLAMAEALGFGAQAAMRSMDLDPSNLPETVTTPKKRKTRYQAAYKRNFNKVKAKYPKKNGQWKQGGFKAAVKEAHRLTKK